MNDCNPVSAMTPPVPSLWRQIVLLCRYYGPRLKWQVIWYAVASLVIAALMAWASCYGFKVPYVMLAAVVCFMIMFAPLAFARYNSRVMDVTLPASWQAKSIFMIGYTAIVIPFVAMLLPVIVDSFFPGEINMKMLVLGMNGFDKGNLPSYFETLMSTRGNIYMNGGLPALLTLYFVLLFKHNVVFKTLVWDIVVGVGVYVAIMVYTIVHMMSLMKEYFVDNVDVTPEQATAFADGVVEDMMIPVIEWSIIGYIVASIVLLVLVTLKIKNRQI